MMPDRGDVLPDQATSGHRGDRRQARVSAKSACQWRRCWRAGEVVALASKGAGGAACRLSAGQLARLRAALDAGPAAYG